MLIKEESGTGTKGYVRRVREQMVAKYPHLASVLTNDSKINNFMQRMKQRGKLPQQLPKQPPVRKATGRPLALVPAEEAAAAASGAAVPGADATAAEVLGWLSSPAGQTGGGRVSAAEALLKPGVSTELLDTQWSRCRCWREVFNAKASSDATAMRATEAVMSFQKKVGPVM
eukprot:scaffold23.g4198.t1